MRTNSKTKTERRKSQRLGLVLPVKYKKENSKCYRRGLACQDISGRGIKISLRDALRVNDKLEVILSMPAKTDKLNAFCRVTWCKQKKGGNFTAGLEFLKIKQRQIFMEFLCEKIIDATLNQY